jgi:hypothetical protein
VATGAGWLPAELTRAQPYSMGPVLGCPTRCQRLMIMPAAGTSQRLDNPGVFIAGAFIAPAAVQRAAQATGERALIMEYPKGLREALGLVPPEAERSPSPAERVLTENQQSFVDALLALDED